MKHFWNERYNQEAYIYGTNPNVFFSQQLSELKAGKILLPAEGEGRNAVYAATKGWKVNAFDYSESGREKALELASRQGVEIDYQIHEASEYVIKDSFNVVALIYAHFFISERLQLFPKLEKSLQSAGTVIIEVFSKAQLGRSSGGPKDPELLYDITEIRESFPAIRFSLLEETVIPLDEGSYHQGEAVVIRAVGIKQ